MLANSLKATRSVKRSDTTRNAVGLYIMHPTAMKYIKVQKPTLPFSVFQGHTQAHIHTHTQPKLTRDETA